MATSEEEWKVKRLISELRKETEIRSSQKNYSQSTYNMHLVLFNLDRDGLLQAVSQMRSVIKNLEEQLPLVADEGLKKKITHKTLSHILV